MRERAHVDAAFVERAQEIERRTHHDVIAFTEAIAEQVGDEARWFHYGLTSSDVVDTGLALQLRAAGAELLAGCDRALAAVLERALEHRATPCMGRTHGVHAEPTTFGLKLLGWWYELRRGRDRVERAFAGVAVGKLSGAVGAYGNVDPRVEELVLAELGLGREDVATQVVARDRHAELLASLAILGSSLDRFATEIRHLQRSEVREAAEPFARGQKGSSAMPHKRNPITCERISGLARVLRGNAVAGFENVPLWHERDISHSSAERVVLSDSTTLAHYLLDRFAWVVEGLEVYPERMRRNIDAAHGLTFSGARPARRSSRPGSRARRPTRSCSATRCAPSRRNCRCGSCSRPTPRRRHCSMPLRSIASSTWTPPCATRASHSTAWRQLMSSSLALDHLASGKVRELYDAGDGRLLLVASDRISAFDVVLPTPIPDKGRVLTALSLHWFALTDDIVRNHVISAPRRRVSRGRARPRASPGARCSCAGSRCCRSSASCAATSPAPAGRTTGAPAPSAAFRCPTGLREADRLPRTLFTPVDQGDRAGTTRTSRAEQGIELVGEQRYREVERASIALYERAAASALERGIILADTKFEFGIDADGSLVVGDEVLTPDSSRFWPADSYAPGSSPPSFDKQFVRDWLETQPWDKTPPGPELPDEVRDGTAARYREAYERLAGRPFASYLEEMGVSSA